MVLMIDVDLEEIKIYVVGVGFDYKVLNVENVSMICSYGFLFYFYIVNIEVDMCCLLDWGVIGVFINYFDIF